MDLDQLEAFVAVATLGGFSRASQQLHRTQPAVSRRIQLLEKSLDVALFFRRGREVTLTPEGRAFLPFAEGALASLRDGVCAVHDASGNPGGPGLGVAVVGTLADVQLASALRRFREAHGGDIDLRTATSREVSALVLRGEADVGVRYFADRHPDVESIPLGDERLVLVLPAGHRLAGCETVEPADLVDEHWLSFPPDAGQPDSFGQLLQRSLLGVGISDPRLTIVDSLTAQKRLVQAGYGIAFLPPGGCQDELAGGSLKRLRVTGMDPAQPIVAVRRRSAFERRRVTEFLEAVRETFASPANGSRPPATT